jgi:nitroreductase
VSTNEIAQLKQAQADYPIHELLRARWSPRIYDERPVEPEKLRSVLEAARWSASGGNMQPWAFLIARRVEDADAFAHMVECLNEGNRLWASQAPVLGISVASLYRKADVRNRHAYHDVGLATQNLVIQATALGLSLRLMGGFSPDKARTAFAIPEEHEAVAMFALGYLGDVDAAAASDRERELAVRTRRPLAEFVFSDHWGAPAPLLTDEV